jgi:hypothetical protein
MIVSFVKKCKKVFTNEGHRRIIQDVTSKQPNKKKEVLKSEESEET